MILMNENFFLTYARHCLCKLLGLSYLFSSIIKEWQLTPYSPLKKFKAIMSDMYKCQAIFKSSLK